MSDDTFWHAVAEAASRRYPAADRHARSFARAKLRDDRVFRHIFQHGLVPAGARVLDAGCGQGLFACALSLVQQAAQRGEWPADWSPAPLGAHVLGIDPLVHDVERARAALGQQATFECADMRRFAFPPSDVVLFLDTLHYIAPAEQVAVLAAARAALQPGGCLLLRVHDASKPLRYAFGLWADRMTMLLHGGGFARLEGCSPSAWRDRLQALGLDVEVLQMNGRAPFRNLLLVARLRGQRSVTLATESPLPAA